MSLNIVNSFNITPPPDTVGGWIEIGRTTLGSPTSTLGVNGLSEKRYYMMLINSLGRNAAATDDAWQPSQLSTFETTALMANRSNRDGASEVTQTSTATPTIGTLSDITPRFLVGYWANVPTKEKLLIHHVIGGTSLGAGTSPGRSETVGKWAQTTNPLDGMRITTVGANTYNTGSEIVFLEWDPADTHTDNFWEELASVDNGIPVTQLSSGTFTAKKYLWFQLYIPSYSSFPTNLQMFFNSDNSNANYAARYSKNGGTESIAANQNFMQWVINNIHATFINGFVINNTANEKLLIGHDVERGLNTASNAPARLEVAGKWANTSAQVTNITFQLDNVATFGAGSKIRVWGSD